MFSSDRDKVDRLVPISGLKSIVDTPLCCGNVKVPSSFRTSSSLCAVASPCSSWRPPWASSPAREASPAGGRSARSLRVGTSQGVLCICVFPHSNGHLGSLPGKPGTSKFETLFKKHNVTVIIISADG